ncbi:mutator type transposase [Tanacetum coccineum]
MMVHLPLLLRYDIKVERSKEIVEVVKEGFEDEEVDHEDFHSGSDSKYKVEHRRELHLKKNDKVRVRCICRGKVPQFGCEDGDDDSGSKGVVSSGSKGKGQSKEKGQVSGSKGKSNNKTKAGGGIKDKGEYCPWSLQCSKLPNEETWTVKTFKDTHKCLQSRIVKKCTASFLSKSVEESIKPNPKIPLNALKDQLQKQYEVGISKQKAGKMDLLGLDGCFLSGSYPGWILTAVGVDPNNGIYPLAYAIVESENKDSWKWFLDCIGDDLDLFRNLIFTFISDRQKGVIPAIAETFPSAEHRFCLKHIYKNMQLSWRGQMYKEMLWRCAIAITVQRFNKHMDKLKDFKKEAYEWLKKIPPKHWFRQGTTKVISKSDGPFTPNAAKLFKTIVKDAGQIKSDGSLTPNAVKLFKTIVKDARQIKIEWNGGDLYRANIPWGIIATIWNMASNGEEIGVPKSYCHESIGYQHEKKYTRLKLFQSMVQIFRKNLLSQTQLSHQKFTHKLVGHQKKSATELAEGMARGNKLSRAGKSISYNKCKGIGHNQRRCTNDHSSSDPQATQTQ